MGESGISVFIADDIPSLNKGEMAILHGIVESFETIPVRNIFLVSINPQLDRSRYDPSIDIIDGKKLPIIIFEKARIKIILKFLVSFMMLPFYYVRMRFHTSGIKKIDDFTRINSFLKSDIIIMGHDGVLTCLQSLLIRIPLIFYSKILKKKIVVYSASIEKIDGNIKQKIARMLLNLCDLITVREEISYNHLISIGVNRNIVFLTADTAFLLKPSSRTVGMNILKKEGIDLSQSSSVNIGITTSQVMFHHSNLEILDDNEKYTLYLETMANIIDWIIESKDALIIFIPHCIGPGNNFDDRIVASDIHKKIKNKEKFKIIINEYSASELKSVIGLLDFFIGERTHSLIAATSMCIPSIAITFPNDTRTHGIIGKMLEQQENIFNIETLDFESFISHFEQCWNKREISRKRLFDKIPLVKTLATNNGLKLKEILTI
jgi:colanic acid/amylovoran biosynthesis protein